MNDICLVFTPAYELLEDRLEAPLGILYLATYLRANGVDAVVCDLAGVPEDRWVLPEAHVYGFSTYSTTYQRTLKLVDLARETNPDAITIAGGPHASALPESVAQSFDHVVVGEGEIALLEFMQGNKNGKVIRGVPVDDLDTLDVDYSLIDVDSYKRIVDGKHSFTILSSRGCPYRCLFCNSIIMGGHKPIRYRSPGNVIDELTGLLAAYGDIAFRFGDDLFGANKDWLEEFTRRVMHMELTYRAFVRANYCAKPGFAELLYAGGCRHVAMGIESGSDKILRNMHKGQTVAVCREAIQRAKDAGLIVRIYLIVGFWGESWDTIEQTIGFVAETQPHEFVVYPLIPYPGTPLFAAPEQCGLYNIDGDFTHYFQISGNKESQFVYDLADHNRVELQAMKDYLVAELEAMQLSWARDSKGYI